MSATIFPDDLRFEQRLLKSAGFYKGKIDGDYGPLTSKAEALAMEAYEEIKKEYGAFDPRSEKAIATLLPVMQRKARQIMGIADERVGTSNITCKILSGTRTYAEQNRLYAQGRTAEGSIVTNARGGSSNHNFGIAIDVGLFSGGRYFTGANKREVDAYKALAAAVKAQVKDIEWGGDWKSFPDIPHYQLKMGKPLAAIRVAFEAGALQPAA